MYKFQIKRSKIRKISFYFYFTTFTKVSQTKFSNSTDTWLTVVV